MLLRQELWKRFFCPVASPSRAVPFSWQKCIGDGMGGLGEGWRERLFSLRCEKAGPSRAGGDRKAARRAVTVRRRRSLTGIDSRARPKGGRRPCLLGRKALQASTAERGVPLPPKQAAVVLSGPRGAAGKESGGRALLWGKRAAAVVKEADVGHWPSAAFSAGACSPFFSSDSRCLRRPSLMPGRLSPARSWARPRSLSLR